MNFFQKRSPRTLLGMVGRVFMVVFVTLSLLAFTLAWQLRQGISLAEFSSATIQAKEIQLRWEHGLVVTAQEVIITPGTTGYAPATMPKFLRIMRLAEQLIGKIDIAWIKINGVTTALHYQAGDNKVAQFAFQTPDLTGQGTVQQEAEQIRFHIKSLTSKRYKSAVAGELIFFPQQEKIAGHFTGIMADCLPLYLSFNADRQGLSFQAEQQGDIVSITPLVDLVPLSADLRPWLVDRLQAEGFAISRLQGAFSWQHPDHLLKNLQATIGVKEVHYRFEPRLATIYSPLTLLDWQYGVLTIKPQEAKFAGHNCGDSTVILDFTTPKFPVLQLNLDTKTRLDPQLLAVPAHYGLTLPFTQQQGETSINLQLTIPLAKPGLRAQGNFLVTDAVFQLAKTNYNITEADISLRDNEVTINHLSCRQGQELAMTFHGKIIATESPRFHLAGQIQHWQPQWSGLTINLQEPLALQVNQDNRGIKFALGKGHFMLANTALTTAPVVISFTTKTRQLKFANLTIQQDNNGINTHLGQPEQRTMTASERLTAQNNRDFHPKAQISGAIKLQPLVVHCTVALSGGPLPVNALANKGLVLQVDYDKKLTLSLPKSSWQINHHLLTLAKARLESDGKNVDLSAQDLVISGVLAGNLHMSYSIAQQQGQLDLAGINLHPPLSSWFNIPAQTAFQLVNTPGKITVKLNQPNLSLDVDLARKWQLTLTDLGKDKDLFPLLQPLALRAGRLTIFSDIDNDGWHWQGKIVSDLQILWWHNKPLQEWPMTGTINGNGLTMTMGDLLTLQGSVKQRYSYPSHPEQQTMRVSKQITAQHARDLRIKIQTQDLGFSLPDLLAQLPPKKKDETGNKDSKTPLPSLSLTANNSLIHLTKGHSLLADKLLVNWEEGKVVAELHHGQGRLDFTSQGEDFSLKGDRLTPDFLGTVLSESQLQGGVFTILAGGNFHHYDLAFALRNSHLKDFTLLNNVMAFIDTVPSLLTFSMPGYTASGMDIVRAEGALTIVDDLAQINSFFLQTSTLSMTATGKIDLGQQKLDLAINMLSPARDNLAKIPLAGWLFKDNKRMAAITLAVKGDLANPQISTTVFRGIPAKGFDILKRTLNLPLDIAEDIFKD